MKLVHCEAFAADLDFLVLSRRSKVPQSPPMGGCASSPVPSAGVSSFYELQALDIDKQPVEFARFKGQASGGPLLLQGRQAGRYPTPPPPPPPPSRRSTHHLPLPFRRSCSSATPHQSEAATAMHTSRWGPQPHWPHRMAWHRAAPRHAAPTPANPAQHSPRSTPASTPTAANPFNCQSESTHANSHKERATR